MALSDNLISYWSLEEASGSRADATATGNTLTDNNTVTQNPGKIGNAAQFTLANTEFLTHTDNASLSTGDIDFTVTSWVYLDSLVNATIVGKYLITGNQREYVVFFNQNDHVPNNRFTFVVSTNGTATAQVDATTFGAPSTATWYFVVIWHDSVNNFIGISVNDTANTLSHSGGVFDSTADFTIGRIQSAVYYMNGRIDEVGFWKRVLTSAEITELYNAGSGRDYAYISGVVAGQPMALRHTLDLTGARRFGRGIS